MNLGRRSIGGAQKTPRGCLSMKSSSVDTKVIIELILSHKLAAINLVGHMLTYTHNRIRTKTVDYPVGRPQRDFFLVLVIKRDTEPVFGGFV